MAETVMHTNNLRASSDAPGLQQSPEDMADELVRKMMQGELLDVGTQAATQNPAPSVPEITPAPARVQDVAADTAIQSMVDADTIAPVPAPVRHEFDTTKPPTRAEKRAQARAEKAQLKAEMKGLSRAQRAEFKAQRKAQLKADRARAKAEVKAQIIADRLQAKADKAQAKADMKEQAKAEKLQAKAQKVQAKVDAKEQAKAARLEAKELAALAKIDAKAQAQAGRASVKSEAHAQKIAAKERAVLDKEAALLARNMAKHGLADEAAVTQAEEAKPAKTVEAVKPKRHLPLRVIASFAIFKLSTPFQGFAPADMIAKLRAYRPTVKHIVIATLALIMVLRPWLIPLVVFVFLWIVLIAYLTLGPDRIAELVVAGWQRLNARKPELAERLRQRADHLAFRVDALLDRLPERWSEGLYLPDFSQAAAEQRDADQRPDPFDRLARDVQRS